MKLIWLSFVLIFTNACKSNSKCMYACESGLSKCKVFLPDYSNDSIQVFTELYNSTFLLSRLDSKNLKKSGRLSISEIVECEKFLRKDELLLNSYLTQFGKKGPLSGYLRFGLFQNFNLKGSERQYLKVVDSKNEVQILIILLDKNLTEHPSIINQWRKGDFITALTQSEFYKVELYAFLVSLKNKKIEILYW